MSFLRKDKSKSHLSVKDMTAGQFTPQDSASERQRSSSNTGSITQENRPTDTIKPSRSGAGSVEEFRGIQASEASCSGTLPNDQGVETRKKDGSSLPESASSVSSQTPSKRQSLFRSQTTNSSMFSTSSSFPQAADHSDNNFSISPNINNFQEQPTPARPPAEGYSPRSSYGILPQLAESENSDDSDHIIKDNYRGFHKYKASRSIPPLSQPIKPRFRRNGNSLLGKLIHSNRKDSDTSVESSEPSSVGQTMDPDKASVVPGSTTKSTPHNAMNRKSVSMNGSSKHMFRLPSISSHHHHSIVSDSSRHASVSEDTSSKVSDNSSGPSSKNNSVSGPAGSPSRMFDLNLNMEELSTILKNPPKQGSVSQLSDHVEGSKSASTVKEVTSEEPSRSSGWKAPDSWDVTDIGFYSATASAPVSESDDSEHEGENGSKNIFRDIREVSSENSSRASLTSRDAEQKEHSSPRESKKHKKRVDHIPQYPQKVYPILYGTIGSRVTKEKDSKTGKGPNHIVRVFKSDNTFTTVLCPLETTSAELLTIIQRKFFLDTISNYQLSLYVGNNVKLLEPFEKPLKIQMGLLILSGYSNKDKLSLLGREDLTSICKITVENMAIRNLTHEETITLSKDYINVDISSHNLKTIPIIFHQHTYEIENLDVSDNPAIYIPLDFIQSCTNLSGIKFNRNSCSKFPLNFLEAPGLTYLSMEANFLDEIPVRISHLKKLTTVRFNSNQLFYLPKAFGKLTNLVSLNLSSNYFQEYPACVSELLNLQELDLSYNDLAEIPNSIGRLTKLTKLNLCTNKLSKALPNAMANLVNLKRLDIRYNQISNIDVLGSLPNLEVMYASKNMISSFSDKMEKLRLLHLDRNPITSLEFEFILRMLTVLDLSKAKITALPAEFFSKIPHIEKLDLDKNHLVTLPDEIGNLPRLTHLSVYGNNLQYIPATIGNLKSLQYLDLHSNNIESIPSEIWNLYKISYLNLSSNILSTFPRPPPQLVARITSHANNTSNIKDVERDSARYDGPVSLSDSLHTLSIADNRLNEECFEAIAQLTSLEYLNISYNWINEIPEDVLANFGNLQELYLSGNFLTKLPAEDFEKLSELTRLFLNGNKLQTLPPELAKCQNLTHLDVGSNSLRYNISNWPYDWNWCYNKKLRYLNFSGNKRFEIKPSYIPNHETDQPFDSLLVLKDLKVVGLMDVTLTTPNVPDQSVNVRLRTTSSELEHIGYGVSDAMGAAESVAFRDSFIQKFRGNENEVLILVCDGVGVSRPGQGHLISYLTKQLFISNFMLELEKITADSEIEDAMRRTFLNLNKEVNSVFVNKKFGSFNPSSKVPELNKLSLAEDASKGCCMSVVYIKNGIVYSANLGDIEIVVSKSNADYKFLSTKHEPTSRKEFERIRASGGFVFADGLLDGQLNVSRGVGFYDYVPHTHSGPSIARYDPAGSNAVIIMATSTLWNYVTHDLAVDLARQEKDNPMIAAEKLRDHAICYGASEKISVTVISIGDQRKKRPKSAAPYMNLAKEKDIYTGKKRKDRGPQSGDTALRRLNDEIEPPVGKLALVFTDIKNSTLLWDAYPVAMRSAIKLHNTIMRRQLRIIGGYEVKTEGDSFMVSFPTPTSALLWCFNVQKQLLVEDWPNEILETNEGCEVTDSAGNVLYRGLSVRMGIHWGAPVCELDMVTRRMDYFGPMVNRASRIESSADGGQIAVSSDFLREMERLYFMHEQIQSGLLTLGEAYDGNVQAGEIIANEIASIEEMGCEYIELGERKLKGLETPETIVLAFPTGLAMRYELFKKRMSQDEDSSGRILGALPVESVLSLRSLSLRLEHICSIMNMGYNGSDDTNRRSSGDIYRNNIKNNKQEAEVVALLDHLATRIELCVAAIELRQSYQYMRGLKQPIDFTESLSIWTLLDDVRSLMESAHKQ